jgi:hypothetical protein
MNAVLKIGPRHLPSSHFHFSCSSFPWKRKSYGSWTNGAARRAPVRHSLKEIKMKPHLVCTFGLAFASTVTAAISIGAAASGHAHAQLLAQHSGSAYFGAFGEPPMVVNDTAVSGSAYFGPFGEPPMAIKDTAVMGSAAMPTVEPVQGNPDIRTTSGEPPLMIKRTVEMGNAATPPVEPFESNFPETKPAE